MPGPGDPNDPAHRRPVRPPGPAGLPPRPRPPVAGKPPAPSGPLRAPTGRLQPPPEAPMTEAEKAAQARMETILAYMAARQAGEETIAPTAIYKVLMDEGAYQAQRLQAMREYLQNLDGFDPKLPPAEAARVRPQLLATIAEVEERVKGLARVAKEAIAKRP